MKAYLVESHTVENCWIGSAIYHQVYKSFVGFKADVVTKLKRYCHTNNLTILDRVITPAELQHCNETKSKQPLVTLHT